MSPWVLLSWLVGRAFGVSDGSVPASLTSDWEMTSGEVSDQAAGAGAASAGAPPAAAYASDSPVFRMRSRRADYGDVQVDVDVLNRGLRSGRGVQESAWDGIHLWLRYQDPTHLYALSVNRRDNRVVIKKKVTGGSSYGGTYFDLSETASYEVPYGRWQHVTATAADNPDGSVTLRLLADGQLLLEATDDGSEGGPPITGTGRVGLRADNADFSFRGLTVAPLPHTAAKKG